MPKQFLISPRGENAQGKSFFASALERALAVTGREGRVIIIAGAAHVPHVIAAAAAFQDMEKQRMILIPEPEAKNTAAAIVCGAIYAGEGRNILVLTSDHIIGPLESFKKSAAAAAVFARRDAMVVFGIPPRSPETGYGYIEAAETLEIPGGEGAAYRAASFREKPDRPTAEAFLAAGSFYWNSGMFAFSASFIMEEFRRNAPDVLAPFTRLQVPGEDAYTHEGGLRILSSWPGLAEAYAAVRSVSFDYAITERCAHTVMVAAGFDWYDVGSWDEYARLAEAEGASGAEVYTAGAERCFVDADIPVALCGVEDLIVVIRSGKNGEPPSALISRRGETQRVKEIVAQIKTAGRTALL